MRACAGEIHVNQHFARDTFYGNLQENAGPKNLGPHFVRACAVEMHVNISQEPLFTEISGKTCRAQKPRTTLCASLRSRNALHFFARAISCGKLQEKCRAPASRTTLRATLRNRNACQHKSDLMQQFTGKMPSPRT